ncbi:hypothetical protein [Sphingobium nicotianae]|uniref:Uncharacterized protein n=1 Tax=Sphingobium nicotianae TaxID=2782607 RepID=A0A9X1DDS9_9SPHN|nr:hypothetical protein [Sphingobium nicotianae]MBT2187683.1 hypothetical protein [Sphingobium nicotianae]
MSLFSILSSPDTSTSSLSSSSNLQIQQALQALAAKQAAQTGTTGSDGAQSAVSITIEAKRAANAKADAGVDAAMLAKSLRADLDAQYKAAGKKDTADLTTLSGRALATMALNQSGTFSKTEAAAAKLELRTRDRQSAIAMLSSGTLTAASLQTYTTNLMATRATMSAEEQQLRQADPSLR